ncbi:MAG: 2-oxoglutarate dehydrogenase complex dihydrolipoyllysine-residue succinyltransferase [Deltaproteobacteria bacterium]|nr:2-oxoglutarate dehydrogenase complex dihydrolipoyllysine-residue succinyltransferase [Deltaproteobacteria bacterium]
MKLEVNVPSVGESVNEAILAQWLKQDGDSVSKDEPIFVIETDKITLEVSAEATGRLTIKIQEGETVPIGAVAAVIDTAAAPIQDTSEKPDAPKLKTEPESEPEPPVEPESAAKTRKAAGKTKPAPDLSPAVRRLVAEHALDAQQIPGTGRDGRITKGDVLAYLKHPAESAPGTPTDKDQPTTAQTTTNQKTINQKTINQKTINQAGQPPVKSGDDSVTRKPMTPIRKRIAERLVAAKQNTAMLTTFNEIDMTEVQAIRARHKESFREKHGVSLGLMSFFIKASVAALQEFPEINAFIEGDEMVYHHYVNMGIAIGAERGLVVPVIQNAQDRSYADLEKQIVAFVDKIKSNKLDVADLSGGTFTITNGGVYGSLLSTPILNMPQSGILGLHKIEKRPVVVDDAIVIRPMMYVALSYDHRIVDGRGAVTCLKRIKENMEQPERLCLEI